jgi:hypothetical protein
MGLMGNFSTFFGLAYNFFVRIFALKKSALGLTEELKI